RRPQIGENAQQGGLARSVRPDQTDHFAGTNRHVDLAQQRHAAEAHCKPLGFDLHYSSLRNRKIKLNRNGAPIIAVTTPSFSSGSTGNRRMPISAASVSAAPPRPLTHSRRPGRYATSGRRMWGTTRPTNPIDPVTATALPTANAVPAMSCSLNRGRLTPRLVAVSSPNVSASSAGP